MIKKDNISKLLNSENNHIFYFWEELSEDEKKDLLEDVRRVDLKSVKKYYERYINLKNKKISFNPASYFP